MRQTARYYDTANYSEDELLRGTGVVGMISGEHLHPPMTDDAGIWSNAGRWKEGAAGHVRRLLSRAQINAGQIVVDAGCGIGGATRMLTREFDARAVGINISRTQLATARALGTREQYVAAGIEDMPFVTGSIDCVLSVNMFYHVADKARALSEMLRVTAPGGILAFDDWVVTNNATEEDRYALLTHWNPEPVEWITDEQLLDAIEAAGYQLEQVDDYADVGRGVMAEYFAPVFERDVRPMILQHDPVHGDAVADHLRAAIDCTIDMYRQYKMRYLQIIARKP